jgi:DNA-binding response OmpR family regulator
VARGDLILVVEDDEALRTLTRMALEDEGYEVITAENGATALRLLQANHPQLILLDLRMPVMDGWEFGRHYREQSASSAPIVVLTAGSDRSLNLKGLQVDAILPKPYDVEDLLSLVGRFVDGVPAG